MMYGLGGGCGFFPFGWLLHLLLFVAFFLIILWLIRGGKCGLSRDGDAVSILKKRLASGEITKKEFEELKKEIE